MILSAVERGSRYRLVSYPLCLAVIPLALIILATLNYWFTDKAIDVVGAVIFYGVCIVFIGILSLRILELDKSSGVVTLYRYTFRGVEKHQLSLEDIEELEMSYGRGNGFARGGVLMMRSGSTSHQISESDICFGHEKRLLGIRQEILNWIK